MYASDHANVLNITKKRKYIESQQTHKVIPKCL